MLYNRKKIIGGAIMYNALDVAKYILQNSTKGLSNLELQKTLYFSEINYIKKYKKHLINDDFEAWQFGPVVRKVYYEYRFYRANSIDKPQEPILIDNDAKEILDKTIEECNKKSYWKLVEESHKKDGAWEQCFNKDVKKTIPKEKIKQEALNER